MKNTMDNCDDNYETDFFRMLKESPLVKDEVEPEELAIWLDMNNMSTPKQIFKIFAECAGAYHMRYDWMNNDMMNNIRKAFANTINANSLSSISPQFTISYATDKIFKNIFILLFKTSYLDKQCITKKFLKKAKKYKEKFNRSSYPFSKYSIFGKQNGIKYTCCQSLDLYEIFAELVDKLEEKLTRIS